MFAPALAAPFFAIVATFVLIGLSQAHSSTAGTRDNPGWRVWLYFAQAVGELVKLVSQAERWLISKFAAAQLRLLAAWFSALAAVWRLFFQSAGDAAHSISQAVSALDQAVPRIAHRAAAPALRQAKAAHRTATHADAHAARVGSSLDAYKARTAPRLHHLTHAVDVALPNDIAGLRARNKALADAQAKQGGAIKSLEDGAVDTWDWIRSHPLSAVTGVFAGAVAVALTRLGFGFLRCRSWQRLGRSLTCNDANILADLLAAATLVVGAMSLVELAREEQKVVGEAANLIRGFWEA